MTETATNRPFLTVKEGANLVPCSARFLYERIGTAEGPPFFRRGKKIMLPREPFLEWASQQIIR